MIILAIDPGTVQSAWLLLGDGRPERFGIEPNDALLCALRNGALPDGPGLMRLIDDPFIAVIEQIASYGMPVGREVFETVRWSGRFEEALYPVPVHQLPRRAVKLHLCGSARAKDANVRRALLDKFGGRAAIGRKAAPGPLYGIKSDLWAALGVAVTFAEAEA